MLLILLALQLIALGRAAIVTKESERELRLVIAKAQEPLTAVMVVTEDQNYEMPKLKRSVEMLLLSRTILEKRLGMKVLEVQVEMLSKQPVVKEGGLYGLELLVLFSFGTRQ
jgi:hypothetical protein